jgi:hypothetical protein
VNNPLFCFSAMMDLTSCPCDRMISRIPMMLIGKGLE